MVDENLATCTCPHCGAKIPEPTENKVTCPHCDGQVFVGELPQNTMGDPFAENFPDPEDDESFWMDEEAEDDYWE